MQRLQLLSLPLSLLLATSAIADSLILNPSFESNFTEPWPFYGPVDDWSGGSGTNRADGPFHNNGTPVIDGEQIAFCQGAASLSQFVPGIEAGQEYWLQFYYDARTGGTSSISVLVDDIEIDLISNIIPASGGDGYRFRHVPFTAEFDGADIKFTNIPQGDATALIDAVSIVKRGAGDAIIANPSFEASGTPPFDGLLNNLPGWDGIGFFGVVATNGNGFGDNGTAADQDHVVFIDGSGSITQIISGLVPGDTYAFSFAYNATTGDTPRLQALVDGATAWESDVTPVGGNSPFLVQSVNFTAASDTVEIGFAQTNPSGVALIDDVRVTGNVTAPVPCIELAPPTTFTRIGSTATAFVTVDGLALANRPRTIIISSPRPDIIALDDADEFGEIVISLPQGDPTTTVPINVTATGPGSTILQIVEPDGLCTESVASFSVTNSFVINPSFDATLSTPGLGTGPIPAWQGGTGLNTAAQPFADNGTIPDRNNVAFIQGLLSLSQEISGLSPGENYWLQFHYNTRNCCGEPGAFGSDLAVSFDGTELTNLTGILPVGAGSPYHFANVPFTAPASGAGLLEFAHTATGDATLLIDAVSIVPRPETDIVVANPSFEASLPPAGVGYIGPQRLAGWDTVVINGNYGVNLDTVGPFTDNGVAGAGEAVLLIQNNAAISQTLDGFTPGTAYTVEYLVNARNCCSGSPVPYEITIDGLPILEEEIDPVGIGLPYHTRSLTFTPAAASVTLGFETRVPQGSDLTLLLDDIRVFAGGTPEPTALPPLSVDTIANSIVELSWPTSFTGWTLEFSTDLVSWSPADAPANTIGENFVVSDVIIDPLRHYRLTRSAP